MGRQGVNFEYFKGLLKKLTGKVYKNVSGNISGKFCDDFGKIFNIFSI